MKLFSVFTIFLVSLTTLQSQTILTQWNFNSPVPDANTGTGTTTPSIGAGTISTTGGATATFASGDASGGSSDPATGDDSAYNTSTYPAASANDGTAGIVFSVSTVGRVGITVNFDTRHSNTSSRYLSFEYSTTGVGGPWTNAAYFSATAGDTWFNNRTVDLSGVLALDNNANAAFRIVTVFENTATGSGAASYVASGVSSTYGTSGTLRYDMVTVNYATSLPIVLTNFEANAHRNTSVLSFTTATETDNAYFEIERSNDGRIFRKIGAVEGAGTVLTKQNYTFVDENPASGVNYYRLKQVDVDGKFSYSPVRSVLFAQQINVMIAPQPVRDQLQVEIAEALTEDAKWQILDVMGRVVLTGILVAETTVFSADMGRLSDGNYVLNITNTTTSISKQFQKK